MVSRLSGHGLGVPSLTDMEPMETPPSNERLYEARGEVPIARPITQGDVFGAVTVAGLATRPVDVMIVQHPCSMRSGTALRSKLTVVLVEQRSMGSGGWAGNVNFMPLPELRAPQDARPYLADLRNLATVDSSALAREVRIAALSNYGILILQQRQAFYLTRVAVQLSTLAQAFEPVSTELELQYDWVEAAMGAAEEDCEFQGIIHNAEAQFGLYLDENDRRRRKALNDPAARTDVRREIRQEIAARYTRR